jgi:uncharacterized protein (DUF433 family)
MAEPQTSQAYNVTAAHITQTPGVCGGEPCIAGRRIKVRNVYVWHDLMGKTPDEIADQYDLSLVQVHAALTYAYEHLADIRKAMHEEDQFVETLFKDQPSKLPRHLIDDDE